METLTNGNVDIAGLWKGTSVNNVTKCKFMCLVHSEAKQSKALGLGTEKDSLLSHTRRMGGSYPTKPSAPQRVSANHFQRQDEGGAGLVVVNVFSSEVCSCSYTRRLGHDISVNLQDKYYSLFCNFYLYMNGKVL